MLLFLIVIQRYVASVVDEKTITQGVLCERYANRKGRRRKGYEIRLRHDTCEVFLVAFVFLSFMHFLRFKIQWIIYF